MFLKGSKIGENTMLVASGFRILEVSDGKADILYAKRLDLIQQIPWWGIRYG